MAYSVNLAGDEKAPYSESAVNKYPSHNTWTSNSPIRQSGSEERMKNLLESGGVDFRCLKRMDSGRDDACLAQTRYSARPLDKLGLGADEYLDGSVVKRTFVLDERKY